MSSHPIMLRFPSHLSNVSMVESFVERIVHRYHIKPDLYGNILISLTEAVTNAIVHGNNRDESKNVEISLNKSGNRIVIKVSDEGQGFDYQSIPDPTAPGNVSKIGGRGVFLMRQLSDDVTFLNNGSTVEIQFSI